MLESVVILAPVVLIWYSFISSVGKKLGCESSGSRFEAISAIDVLLFIRADIKSFCFTFPLHKIVTLWLLVIISLSWQSLHYHKY